MTMDRGTLARVDRRILSRLASEGGPQMVKVPVSDAAWDVWRRYCRLAGVTMGEGLAVLLACELTTEVGEEAPLDGVLGDQIAVHAAGLRETVAELKRSLNEAQERLAQRDQQVRSLRQQLRTTQQQLATEADHPAPAFQRVGRNDRCPCGSGLKYKFCHAIRDRLAGL